MNFSRGGWRLEGPDTAGRQGITGVFVVLKSRKSTRKAQAAHRATGKAGKRLNILFLSTENPFPPNSGHRLRTYNTLRDAASRHNVFFLGFAKSMEDLKYTEPLREFCKSADVFVIPDDISKVSLMKSLILNLFSILPYTAQKYYTNDMRRRMGEILDENRIDIVHFDMLHLARYRHDIPALPTVMIEHNVESLRLKRLAMNSSNPALKIFLYLQYMKLYSFEKRECSRFNVCAPVSEYDRDCLQKMSPTANLRVVPNGVDTKYFSPGKEKIVPKSLVWVGGMKDLYNREAVEYFCRSIFPLIIRDVPDVKFIAIGKSPAPALEELARTNPNIKISGYVEDIRKAMRKAAVYIAPMKSGGGTKLKVLNALSMAKPLVTTSVGAEGIDVTDGVHLMIADDAAGFAKKTVELLNNPVLAKRLGTNGRKRMMEKYSWDIIGRQIDEIYHEIAGRTKSEKSK